jgi:hypothetical protein
MIVSLHIIYCPPKEAPAAEKIVDSKTTGYPADSSPRLSEGGELGKRGLYPQIGENVEGLSPREKGL